MVMLSALLLPAVNAVVNAAGRSERAIDELRVSDVARYVRGFTPPRFHKEDENTALLLRFDTLEEGKLVDTSGRGRVVTPYGDAPKLAESGR